MGTELKVVAHLSSDRIEYRLDKKSKFNLLVVDSYSVLMLMLMSDKKIIIMKGVDGAW